MCTAISLLSEQQHRFLGRTMDFPIRPTPWQFGYLPVDYQWKSLPENNRFINDYAILGGMRKVGNHFLIGDGLNSAGLWVAELYFPGAEVYYDQPQTNQLNLSPQDMIGWLLGKHATVAEIKAELSQIALNGVTWYDHDIVHPFHWFLSDQTGTYIIEPTQHQLTIQPIKLGVLTNSPRYDRQRQKLTASLKLESTASDREIIDMIRHTKAVTVAKRTPTARFLNATYHLWQSSSVSDQEALKTTTAILNHVKMPKLAGHENYTQYLATIDPQTQTCYFHDLIHHEQLIHRLPDLMARFDRPILFS